MNNIKCIFYSFNHFEFSFFLGQNELLSSQAQILLKNKQKQKDKDLKSEKSHKKSIMINGVKKESDYMRKKALAAATASLNYNASIIANNNGGINNGIHNSNLIDNKTNNNNNNNLN